MIRPEIISCERSLIRKIKEDTKEQQIDIDLSIGIPDFPIYPALQKKIMEEIQRGNTRYAPNQGDSELLSALAQKYSVNENETLVTVGAAEAIFAAMFATLKQNDEIVILCPAYPAYSHLAKMLGVRCRFVEAGVNGLDFEKLKKQTAGARMVVACSPNNPDGMVLEKRDIRAIAEIAEDSSAVVLADECYESLAFETHHTFLGENENVIKIASASKMFSATGIRIGWLVSNKKIIEQLIKVQNFVVSGAPSAEQRAVAYCITNKIGYSEMRKEFEKRAELASSILRKHSVKHLKPRGAFYIFPEVRSPSYKFCLDAAKDKKVLAVPGSAFDSGEGHVRIALTVNERKLERGVEMIAEAVVNG